MHADDRPPVLVDGGDAVAAVAREPRELNVPVGRLDVFVLSGRQLVPPHAGELAAGVGQVVEPFRVGVELGGAVLGGGLVGRQVGHPALPGIPDIDVGVGGRLRLAERHPSAIAGDVGDLIARRVLVDQGPFEFLGIVAVDVEEPRVALVGQDVERRVVARPAGEDGLELRARGQVGITLRAENVEVIVLIAPLVVCVKDSLVPGEERDREGRVGGRPGQRRHRAALERDGVGVGDARGVGREEHARAVGRERRAADRRRRQELLDGVLPDDTLVGCGLVPAGVQVVVMERRVEQEHEAAVGLVPPHRVVAEEDDVTLPERHVDDRGRSRELGAPREHAADPEVFLVGPAEDHARPHPRRAGSCRRGTRASRARCGARARRAPGSARARTHGAGDLAGCPGRSPTRGPSSARRPRRPALRPRPGHRRPRPARGGRPGPG